MGPSPAPFFPVCDGAMVTNIGEGDHLGLGGIETSEQLAAVKRVVVENVAPSGFAVLNADDPMTVAMAPYCPGGVIFFARRPGQVVTRSITLTVKNNAVVVPSQAVQTGQKGQHVFVVRQDATAEIRPVVAGPVSAGMTVIESGLKPGEQVVIDGQMRVVPGGKVEIKKADKPGQSGMPAK